MNEREMTRKKIATVDAALAQREAFKASTLASYDAARHLIFSNEQGLTPQEALDSLWEEDAFAATYGTMAAARQVLATQFPELTVQDSPVEIVPYTEGGKLGAVVTEVPFDITRAPYPVQEGRAAAEAFAASLVAPESDGETEGECIRAGRPASCATSCRMCRSTRFTSSRFAVAQPSFSRRLRPGAR